MFHGLWLIIALILAVSLSLYLVVMAVLVTAYLLFCGFAECMKRGVRNGGSARGFGTAERALSGKE